MVPIPFDSLLIKALAEEIGPRLVGERLGPFRLLDSRTLAIGGKGHFLVLSVDPSLPALHLTPDIPSPPRDLRPPLVNVLRARLEGARLTAARAIPGERIFLLRAVTDGRLLDEEVLTFAVEFFGPKGDMVLLSEEGTVVETLRHQRAEPGDSYPLPVSPVRPDRPGIGASPFLAREIAYREGEGSDTSSLWAALWSVPGTYEPSTHLALDPPLYPIPPHHLGMGEGRLPSLAEALRLHHQRIWEARAVERVRKALSERVASRLEKAQRKAAAQEAELLESRNAERLLVAGQALLAHQASIRPGDTRFTFVDWTTGTEATVDLPPGKSAIEAAELLFRRHKRLASRRSRLAEELRSSQAHLAFWQERLDEISLAESLQDLEAVAALFPAEDRPADMPGRRDSLREDGRLFRTTSGRLVRVGRNARENEVVWRRAKPADLWLHAKDLPGSHVVLSAEGGIGERDILEAALLAAHFSKGRAGKHVSVDWTERRHIRKLKGAPPGFVVYDHETNVLVHLDEEAVEPLLKSERSSK